MRNERFSELVGGIYDAVVDPGLWAEAVDAIREEFRFHMSMLAVIKVPSNDLVVSVSANVPEAYLARFPQYADDALALWGGVGALSRFPLEEPVLHTPFLPANWHQNRYYLEWCKPQGLVDQLVIFLANDRMTNASVAFGIHETRGPVEQETMDDLRLLAPHLRRAVNISRLLDMTTNAAATFEAALSAMGSGAVLVEADMNIVYANPVAQRMLREGDAIRNVNGRLALATALVPHQLELAVAAAAGPESRMGRHGIGIPGRRRDGAAVVLHVLPLKQRSPRTGAPWKSAAAVFIADIGGPAAVPLEALAALFDLTPTEKRVLELTAQGHSGRAVAEALGIAPSTVKTHLLSLYEKTGRHRREDLVRLARDAALPS